jgi:ribosomal protein S27AE
MLRRLLSCLAALFILAAPALAQRPAPDWSRTLTMGPNGAYVLGNPQAKTKLVEYLSYTCPHCGAFQKEAAAALKAQWIRRGLLSLEFRNFVREPYDLAAALLARCGGPGRFLANHDALFANQEVWLKAAQTFSQSEAAAAAGGDQIAQLTRIAEGTGLFALLARTGLSPDAQRRCLADKQALSHVLNLTTSAWDTPDFNGTPFFLLNGKPLANVHDWGALRPLIPALPRSGN